jgi:DNA-binding MarR family transcriptional regulator
LKQTGPLSKRIDAMKQDTVYRGLRRRSVIGWLHLLRISHRVLQSAATQFTEWNLSTAQFDVLSYVGADEGISQLDLAQRLLVTQGNITQLLDKMESRGLIQRVPEGRTKRLYLTAEGRQLYSEVVPFHQDFIASQFSALTPDEQRQLLHLLAKLDRAQRAIS